MFVWLKWSPHDSVWASSGGLLSQLTFNVLARESTYCQQVTTHALQVDVAATETRAFVIPSKSSRQQHG